MIDKVTQMKNEGQSESQIINTLKQEGISPKEIYDAITQSSIKSEVSQNQSNQEPEEQAPEAYYPEESQQQYTNYNPYSEQPQEYQQQPQNSGEGYQQYELPQPAADFETINEIAEQIVEEKTQEIKKQISSYKNTIDEVKIDSENINKRLEKLENNFNELQTAIIRKIGEYGENIKNISNEMHETQNSFSKVLNPLTDNIRELQKMTGSLEKPLSKEIKKQESKPQEKETEAPVQEQERKRSKPEPGFEDYLR